MLSLVLLLFILTSSSVSAFSSLPTVTRRSFGVLHAEPPSTPPPILNGKMVIPMRVLLPGLKGHEIAAVYAVLTSGFVKSDKTTEWSKVKFVGTTNNLHRALLTHLDDHGSDKVAHIRALSFQFPQEGAMQDVAMEWRQSAVDADAKLADWMTPEILQRRLAALAEEDDDDFDEDDIDVDDLADGYIPPIITEGDSPVSSGDIESPFQAGGAATETQTKKKLLKFNAETVDKVLEEVRPYLISDGGNVSVQDVQPEEKKIFLKLEGACGSCASSTVTMSMGIERVLKENFGEGIEVIQVENEEDQGPTELTREAIETEVNRISPAMQAMGAEFEILEVDPIGEVKVRFRGSNNVRQGFELALLDVPYCKHITFVSQ